MGSWLLYFVDSVYIPLPQRRTGSGRNGLVGLFDPERLLLGISIAVRLAVGGSAVGFTIRIAAGIAAVVALAVGVVLVGQVLTVEEVREVVRVARVVIMELGHVHTTETPTRNRDVFQDTIHFVFKGTKGLVWFQDQSPMAVGEWCGGDGGGGDKDRRHGHQVVMHIEYCSSSLGLFQEAS
jgi:hypothetical protein